MNSPPDPQHPEPSRSAHGFQAASENRRTLTAARVLSGAGALASCLPMVAMLPGGFAAMLGFLGLGASSAAVTTLSPHLNSIVVCV